MTTVGLEEAKARLEELLEGAAAGERVVIIKDDGSAFELVPRPKGRRGGFGSLKGLVVMSEDFDEPLEDFRDYMG